MLDDGQAGDMVGLLVRSLKREVIMHWMVIAKPGVGTFSTKFKAEIYVLFEIEGGRKTLFFSNFSPQFFLRTAYVTGRVKLGEKVKIVIPW
ncbi:unnamed protein product [Arabis nemorensis]|uniref:Translation elongation factor EFTu/EF1A C-terminal domain-containing protein n=1 Tax=Arabis nemorensis TaxID=586526 RepID=A0A565CH62_9BRAS|nr:unnamed protein product [Arabis nemorensis]